MSTIKPGMEGYDPNFKYGDVPVKGKGLEGRKVAPSAKENPDMLAKAVFGKMQSPELEAFKKNIQFVQNKKFASSEHVVDKLVAYEKEKMSKFVMKQDTNVVSGDDLYKQLFDVILASKAPFKEMGDRLSQVTPREIREHIMTKVAEHIWQNSENRWASGEDLFDNRRVLRRLGGEFEYAVRESSQAHHYTVAFTDSTGNFKEFRIKKMDLIELVSTSELSKEELIHKLESKISEIFEETLGATGVWYDPLKNPQNPLLTNPSLKYSVRLSSTDPDSYGIGILVSRDGKNTLAELRMKKNEFMELTQKYGMRSDKIAQEVQSRLTPKAQVNPYAQLEADLRKIGRLYMQSEKNPLLNAPQLKYSVRASSDPDCYAIGVITGNGRVQELRVKKSEFLDMVFNQKMAGERIAEEIRTRLSGKRDEGPDISHSLQAIKSITTNSRDRLAKTLEFQKIMNSEINILLKEDPAHNEKCLLLLAAVLNCEPSDVDTLKSAYRKLSLLVHPDKVKSSELFQLASDLWEKSGMKEK